MEDAVTEHQIQTAIYWDRCSAAMVAPNYTPHGWYECDVWVLTKASYGYEFEIKTSVADFRADAKKEGGVSYRYRTGTVVHRSKGGTKHTHLEYRDPVGPSRFWFVVPADMVALTDVPNWAGLIYAHARPYNRVRLTVVRDAPRLHRVKVSDRVRRHAASVFYHRYWNLRNKRSDLFAADGN